MRARLSVVVAVTAVFSVVLAGCGGSGGSGTEAASDTAIAQPQVVTDTPSSPTAEETPVSSVSDAKPAAKPDAAKFCGVAKALNDMDDLDEPTPANVAEAMKRFRALADAAPSEIKAAAKAFAENMSELIAKAKPGGEDIDLTALGPDAQKAFGDLLGYMADNCPGAMD